MLPLMTTTNTHHSSHSEYPLLFISAPTDGDGIKATFVLHSLFPSLQALAHGASEHSLEILDDVEAKGVVNFLDVEFVSGG